MTKISVYNIDEYVTADDKWIGTDVNTYNKTKNFTPRKLSHYFNNNQVINTGVDLLYKYFTITPPETRPTGTLSFETEIGQTVNFSAISTFLLSKTTLKGNDVVEFLNFLVGTKVLLYKAKNINIFGNYKIVSVEEYLPEPNFFVVNVEFIDGNGFIEEDEDYMISVVDIASGVTNLSYTPGVSNGTVNSDTGTDAIIPLAGSVNAGLFSAAEKSKLQGLSQQNLQEVVNIGNGISNYGGVGNASIQSTNFSNNRTLYLNNDSFPTIKLEDNLNSNHYTVIDIDTLNLSGVSYPWSSIVGGTQNLQEVTDEGATTTNSITANSFIKSGGIGDNVLLDDGNTIPLTSIESVTTSPIKADLTVGGIANQQIIPVGTDLQEFATLLLSKTYYPTLTSPTFSLSNSAGTREIGSSSAFNLTFSYDNGDILGATVGGVWQPSTSQGGRSGSAISYTINGTTQAGNTLSVSPTLSAGGNIFNATVTYGIGIQPLDSKGVNYDVPYPAGTSPTRSTTVQGIYPYFWYKSSSPITSAGMQTAIVNGLATKVVSSSTGTITIDFNATGEYLAFAYPSASTTKTVWYVTALSNGTIPGGVFGGATTLLCNSPASLWSNISYKIHVTAGLITESEPMQLRNS